MDKFKICPVCGEKNSPSLFECRKCETDLTGVKVTDDTASEQNRGMEANVNDYVRICECGHKNPVNIRKCERCGDDISDIFPIALDSQIKKFKLSSLDNKYQFEIIEPFTIIGRDFGMADYLSSRKYVSRSHAKLIIENEKLFIENLSKTNPTFVNDLAVNGKVEIHCGDEIGLGGKIIDGVRQENAAYFKVSEI